MAGSQQTNPSSYPLSSDIVHQVVIYDSSKLVPLLRGTQDERYSVMEEIQRCLHTGPGVVVIRDLVPKDVVDRAVDVTETINPRDPTSTSPHSHRTFGFTERHAKHDPESFAEYYGNDLL
jgi:hypothetical protein